MTRSVNSTQSQMTTKHLSQIGYEGVGLCHRPDPTLEQLSRLSLSGAGLLQDVHPVALHVTQQQHVEGALGDLVNGQR